jgi:Ca2+-transporting ATPase
MLCNDARLVRTGEKLQAHGDPTELALLIAGERAGLVHSDTQRQLPRLDAIPFDSAHMFRATLHGSDEGGVIYKVGAVERVLERCAYMLDRKGTKIAVDRALILGVMTGMAERGLRVLACARREVERGHPNLEHKHVAEGLTLLGLVGMMDPPRPEVVNAVHRCQEAGIAVKMITGDHLVTARVIAKQVGIKNYQAAITGRELETVPDERLPEVAAATAVFARVAPDQKLRLVKALQAHGHVVAMTGDGVNDAPALKQADIGVAMGISGTETAKSAADMVLTDDNFATIEAAVEEGRNVFDNLRKFIVWNLPTNAGESAILLLAIALGITLPMLPLQILWLNLAETIVLGLTLVFEPKEPGLMHRSPRDPRAPLLGLALLMRTGLVTLVMLVGAFWLFIWELGLVGESVAQARTAVVNVLVLVELAYLFNCRSLHRPCFGEGFFGNRWLFLGAAVMLAGQLFFTYAPLMNRLFHTAPIGVDAWIRILAVAAGSFVIVELEKWLRYGRNHGAAATPE